MTFAEWINDKEPVAPSEWTALPCTSGQWAVLLDHYYLTDEVDREVLIEAFTWSTCPLSRECNELYEDHHQDPTPEFHAMMRSWLSQEGYYRP